MSIAGISPHNGLVFTYFRWGNFPVGRKVAISGPTANPDFAISTLSYSWFYCHLMFQKTFARLLAAYRLVRVI